MNQLLERSQEIVSQAIADHKPYAIVSMCSGGKDSMLAYQVAKRLGVKIDFLMHGNTRTGIQETTQFVRDFAASEGARYIEADAGRAYEDYVLRKGFFGRGRQAHSFAYHILKRQRFHSAVARHIRQGKRDRPVLFLNGARSSESANRAQNMPDPIRRDGKAPNFWVNVCHEWSQSERDNFLCEVRAPVNSVTTQLCRSGECMCLAPDTLISTPSGWKPIGSLCVGEMIHNFEEGKVQARAVELFHANIPAPMREVKTRLLRAIKATPNHPIFVKPYSTFRTKTSRAKKVEEALYMSVGEIETTLKTNAERGTYDKRGFYAAYPFRTEEKPTGLNEVQLKLLGYFMAEGAYNYRSGRTKPGGVIFTVSGTHNMEMAEDIRRCLVEGLGAHVHWRDWVDARSGRRFITIRTLDHASAEFITDHTVGRYCKEKYFAEHILAAPLAEQAIILATMWEGDGADYVVNRPARNGRAARSETIRAYSTGSLIMALQVQEMLLRRGEIYNLKEFFTKTTHGELTMFQVTKSSAKSRFAFIESGVLWTEIEKISPSEVLPRINLTIAGEPNFITEGGLVHNCGTSQSKADRAEAAAMFPDWGRWLTELENRAFALGHSWGWGEDCDAMNPILLERAGQMRLDFQPMCHSCMREMKP